MPFVKGPGTDREIWLDLHDPIQDMFPWFVAAGTGVKLTPEQCAAEMADPNSEWDFSFAHEAAAKSTPEEISVSKANVQDFERLLRKARAHMRGVGTGGRGRGGRPTSTIFSAADDISVIAFHFILSGMKRQAAINRALDYWINSNKQRVEPAKRLIDAAMARIRRGGTANLPALVEFVRAKYSLPELPQVQLHGGKQKQRIK
jgi:hypothetical protein